jgi:hypothetical protein
MCFWKKFLLVLELTDRMNKKQRKEKVFLKAKNSGLELTDRTNQ